VLGVIARELKDIIIQSDYFSANALIATKRYQELQEFALIAQLGFFNFNSRF